MNKVLRVLRRELFVLRVSVKQVFSCVASEQRHSLRKGCQVQRWVPNGEVSRSTTCESNHSTPVLSICQPLLSQDCEGPSELGLPCVGRQLLHD